MVATTAISTAAVQAYKVRRLVGGVAITYSDGTNNVTLTALHGETRQAVANIHGVIIEETRLRDFLVLVSELILNSVVVLPSRGDTIAEDGKNYSVMADGGEPHFVYSDHSEKILRIHTIEKD